MTAENISAVNGTFTNLTATNGSFNDLTAGSLWADTASFSTVNANTGNFDQVNASGITGGTASLSAVYVNTGSATVPTVSFNGNTNTGLFSSLSDTLNFAAGGANYGTVDTNGGRFYSSYRLKVSKTALQGPFIANSTTNAEIITFDQIDFDPSSQWNGTTNAFTAQVSGVYSISVALQTQFINTAQSVALGIWTNGVSVGSGEEIIETRTMAGASVTGEIRSNSAMLNSLVSLTAGQTIQVRMYSPTNNAATVYGFPIASYLVIHLISANLS